MDIEFDAFEVNEGEKLYNIRHRCFFFSKEILFFVKDCKYEKYIVLYLIS